MSLCGGGWVCQRTSSQPSYLTVYCTLLPIPVAEMYGERLFFTYTGSDGAERELTPGGAMRRVTFDNRLTFCRMVEQARTREFDAQVRFD